MEPQGVATTVAPQSDPRAGGDVVVLATPPTAAVTPKRSSRSSSNGGTTESKKKHHVSHHHSSQLAASNDGIPESSGTQQQTVTPTVKKTKASPRTTKKAKEPPPLEAAQATSEATDAASLQTTSGLPLEGPRQVPSKKRTKKLPTRGKLPESTVGEAAAEATDHAGIPPQTTAGGDREKGAPRKHRVKGAGSKAARVASASNADGTFSGVAEPPPAVVDVPPKHWHVAAAENTEAHVKPSRTRRATSKPKATPSRPDAVEANGHSVQQKPAAANPAISEGAPTEPLAGATVHDAPEVNRVAEPVSGQTAPQVDEQAPRTAVATAATVGAPAPENGDSSPSHSEVPRHKLDHLEPQLQRVIQTGLRLCFDVVVPESRARGQMEAEAAERLLEHLEEWLRCGIDRAETEVRMEAAVEAEAVASLAVEEAEAVARRVEAKAATSRIAEEAAKRETISRAGRVVVTALARYWHGENARRLVRTMHDQVAAALLSRATTEHDVELQVYAPEETQREQTLLENSEIRKQLRDAQVAEGRRIWAALTISRASGGYHRRATASRIRAAKWSRINAGIERRVQREGEEEKVLVQRLNAELAVLEEDERVRRGAAVAACGVSIRLAMTEWVTKKNGIAEAAAASAAALSRVGLADALKATLPAVLDVATGLDIYWAIATSSAVESMHRDAPDMLLRAFKFLRWWTLRINAALLHASVLLAVVARLPEPTTQGQWAPLKQRIAWLLWGDGQASLGGGVAPRRRWQCADTIFHLADRTKCGRAHISDLRRLIHTLPASDPFWASLKGPFVYRWELHAAASQCALEVSPRRQLLLDGLLDRARCVAAELPLTVQKAWQVRLDDDMEAMHVAADEMHAASLPTTLASAGAAMTRVFLNFIGAPTSSSAVQLHRAVHDFSWIHCPPAAVSDMIAEMPLFPSGGPAASVRRWTVAACDLCVVMYGCNLPSTFVACASAALVPSSLRAVAPDERMMRWLLTHATAAPSTSVPPAELHAGASPAAPSQRRVQGRESPERIRVSSRLMNSVLLARRYEAAAAVEGQVRPLSAKSRGHGGPRPPVDRPSSAPSSRRGVQNQGRREAAAAGDHVDFW